MKLLEKIREFFTPARPLKPGLYHRRGGEEDPFRLHLRIEEDGHGILIINASRVLHLSPTAAEYALGLVEGKSEDEILRQITSRYHIDKKTALGDYTRVRETVETLARTSDVCPVSFLDVERMEPFSRPTRAPYRMDLALTYRCDNHCVHCYNDREERKPEDFKELSTPEWKRVLDILWEIGVPHVTFTGGEPTLREDLPELIRHAEETGIVTGLNTHGRALSDADYVKKLAGEGLDHLQITIESHEATVHDDLVGADGAWKETVEGIKNPAASNIYTMTNTTLTTKNTSEIEKTVAFLAGLGLSVFACNGLICSGKGRNSPLEIPQEELGGLLRRIRDAASLHRMKFIWYTPTRYCLLNPVEAGLGPKQCSAARVNMCAEPNGDVIPCQSYYKPVGNLLRDEWDKIWNHDLCLDLRERRNLPEECRKCPQVSLCGGGCPLDLKKERFVCRETLSGN